VAEICHPITGRNGLVYNVGIESMNKIHLLNYPPKGTLCGLYYPKNLYKFNFGTYFIKAVTCKNCLRKIRNKKINEVDKYGFWNTCEKCKKLTMCKIKERTEILNQQKMKIFTYRCQKCSRSHHKKKEEK